jgi:hypothetical protein
MYCPELNEPMEVRRILLKNSAWRPKTTHLSASADLCARDETLHPVTGLASPGRSSVRPGHGSQVDRPCARGRTPTESSSAGTPLELVVQVPWSRRP